MVTLKGKTYTIAELDAMSIRQVNKLFRFTDESRLWPISSKFNATERAIRRLRRLQHGGLYFSGGAEYALALESTISDIVNSQI